MADLGTYPTRLRCSGEQKESRGPTPAADPSSVAAKASSSKSSVLDEDEIDKKESDVVAERLIPLGYVAAGSKRKAGGPPPAADPWSAVKGFLFEIECAG